MTVTSYVLEHAWINGQVQPDVSVAIKDGRFAAVGGRRDPAASSLPGLTIPGLADCHSHAFHRVLPGGAQSGGGFAPWLEQRDAAAARLDPDSYLELATAVYAELAAGGVTTVGEFHYVHHQADGTSYDEANAMGLALIEAARQVGIRVALLDSCYLTAGIGRPVDGVQRRFSDGTGRGWQDRADELTTEDGGDVVVGAAIHSVPTVPLDDMRMVADWADRFEVPLHVHLPERVAENEECLDAYGRTPTEVLAEAGALGDRTTVVHATHLSGDDVVRLGDASCRACFCPSHERGPGGGAGPSVALRDRGARLTLGTASHPGSDMFEQMRTVEGAESPHGHSPAGSLLDAATSVGHGSLGFPDAGRIAVGARADLVTLDLTSPEATAGGSEATLLAATAADVRHVVAGGRVVFDGDTAAVGARLDAAVRKFWGER